MILEILSLILILSKLEDVGSYALTSRRTQPDETLVDNIKLEEMSRIKKYLHTMKGYNEDQTHGGMRDPSSYCRSFQNCYECVKSMWFPCGWCHNYGCTENPEKLCPFAETTAEKSNITGEIKACPHVQHEGPILIPSGIRINIKVKLYIPDPVMYDKEIMCQIKIKDRLTHLKGLILNDVVYCYPITLQIEAIRFGDTDIGSLKLIWGGAQPYSNEIPLIVYNCETLAVDCESCRLIPSAYACGWCDQSSKCVISDKCSNDMMKWTLNRLTCEHYGKKLLYV